LFYQVQSLYIIPLCTGLSIRAGGHADEYGNERRTDANGKYACCTVTNMCKTGRNGYALLQAVRQNA
jgi:hypothetical protein